MKVLITGATNGMGKGVARALAAHPQVELVLLGRSEQLLRETSDELSRLSAPGRVSTVLCDLARLRDVRAAIAELHSKHPTLDALFVNAGLGYAPRRQPTEDGFDAHFQVNYLSQFMLTLSLLEGLERLAHGGRVVFNAAEFGELHWDDLQLERAWTYEKALGQAMVARRMLFRRLHELYAARQGVAVSCFGYAIARTVWTNQINLIPSGMRFMARVMKGLGQFISIDACGELMAPLFLESREVSLEKSGRLLTVKQGRVVECEKSPQVLDAGQRERLWAQSVSLCADEATTRAARRLTGA